MEKKVKIINPAENELKAIRGIKWGEFISRWVATLTTSGGAYLFGVQAAAKYLPESLAWVPGIAAAVVAALLTDHIFGNLLQKVVYNWLAANHPNVQKWTDQDTDIYFLKMRQRSNQMYVALLIGLFAFDIYTTWAIREPVADSAKTTPIVNIDSLRQAVAAAYDAQLHALKNDASELEKKMATQASRVEQENTKLAALKNEGNGWASNLLTRKKNKATAETENAKKSVTKAYAATAEGRQSYIDARIAEQEAANRAALDRNQSGRTTMSAMYLLFSIVPKLLAVFLRIFMVVIFLTYSKDQDPDISGDGIIDYRDVQALANRKK